MRSGQGEVARKYGKFFLKLATEGVVAQNELIALIRKKLPLGSGEEISWLKDLLFEFAPEEGLKQVEEASKVRQKSNRPLVGAWLGNKIGKTFNKKEGI